MAVTHITALELLGNNISFTVHNSNSERYHSYFPKTQHRSGQIKGVFISFDDEHEVLIDNEFYLLSEITFK